MQSPEETETYIEPITKKQIEKIMATKKPAKVINGVIQEDKDNPDYLYLIEDD